jgi:hypothetical protein
MRARPLRAVATQTHPEGVQKSGGQSAAARDHARAAHARRHRAAMRDIARTTRATGPTNTNAPGPASDVSPGLRSNRPGVSGPRCWNAPAPAVSSPAVTLLLWCLQPVRITRMRWTLSASGFSFSLLDRQAKPLLQCLSVDAPPARGRAVTVPGTLSARGTPFSLRPRHVSVRRVRGRARSRVSRAG